MDCAFYLLFLFLFCRLLRREIQKRPRNGQVKCKDQKEILTAIAIRINTLCCILNYYFFLWIWDSDLNEGTVFDIRKILLQCHSKRKMRYLKIYLMIEGYI
jgi:hypothetical protein